MVAVGTSFTLAFPSRHLFAHFWAANSLTKPFLIRLWPLGAVMITWNQPAPYGLMSYVSMAPLWPIEARLARISR
jgi:hypothetical protein